MGALEVPEWFGPLGLDRRFSCRLNQLQVFWEGVIWLHQMTADDRAALRVAVTLFGEALVWGAL